MCKEGILIKQRIGDSNQIICVFSLIALNPLFKSNFPLHLLHPHLPQFPYGGKWLPYLRLGQQLCITAHRHCWHWEHECHVQEHGELIVLLESWRWRWGQEHHPIWARWVFELLSWKHIHTSSSIFNSYQTKRRKRLGLVNEKWGKETELCLNLTKILAGLGRIWNY